MKVIIVGGGFLGFFVVYIVFEWGGNVVSIMFCWVVLWEENMGNWYGFFFCVNDNSYCLIRIVLWVEIWLKLWVVLMVLIFRWVFFVWVCSGGSKGVCWLMFLIDVGLISEDFFVDIVLFIC